MKTLCIVLAVIACIALVSALEAWVIMMLWNWVVVSLFAVQPIGFWLAFGIMCMLSIIGSFFRTTIKKN